MIPPRANNVGIIGGFQGLVRQGKARGCYLSLSFQVPPLVGGVAPGAAVALSLRFRLGPLHPSLLVVKQTDKGHRI